MRALIALAIYVVGALICMRVYWWIERRHPAHKREDPFAIAFLAVGWPVTAPFYVLFGFGWLVWKIATIGMERE